MNQLRMLLKLFISNMEMKMTPDQNLYFTKWDTTNGFWQLAVKDRIVSNLCYVISVYNPLICIDKTEILVPNLLELVWCEFTLLFSTRSENLQDFISTLLSVHHSIPIHFKNEWYYQISITDFWTIIQTQWRFMTMI